MLIDVIGKINEKKLVYNNTLLPLFEAIVNFIQAIEEYSATNQGIIQIDITRSPQRELNLNGTERLPHIIDPIMN